MSMKLLIYASKGPRQAQRQGYATKREVERAGQGALNVRTGAGVPCVSLRMTAKSNEAGGRLADGGSRPRPKAPRQDPGCHRC
jgi:hypothetical protein